MPTTHRQWIYRRRPEATVGSEHYELREQPLDTTLGAGEVLIEARYFSVDPYMRIGQSGRPTYDANPHPLDVVQEGGVVAQVVASLADGFAPGDWVRSYTGWQTHARVTASALCAIDPAVAPVSTALGVLGMPGRTAWFGLTEAGRPHAGEVVVVSGAAGAVGSLVGQIARQKGAARVIGSAGSVAKVRYLRETLGFDAAFNYKDGDVAAQLRTHAPDGIDVYFDNVGGDHLEAALGAMRVRGRIIACGAISRYNDTAPAPGPRNLALVVTKRLLIRGFIVTDWLDRAPAFAAEVGAYLRDGRLRAKETVVDGLDRAPEAFIEMLRGGNVGKMIVKV